MSEELKMEDGDFFELALWEERVQSKLLEVKLAEQQLAFLKQHMATKYSENGKYTIVGIDPKTRSVLREQAEASVTPVVLESKPEVVLD